MSVRRLARPWQSRVALAARSALLAGGLAMIPGVAAAHPLGNFSINHFNGISVTPDNVVIDHVLDMAEIPTFSERARMDGDGDGDVSGAEAASYAERSCGEAAAGLELRADGRRLAPAVRDAAVSFPAGQGAPTLRLECTLEAALPATLGRSEPASFEFRDPRYAERMGWREIVVAGAATTIGGSDAPSVSTSGRLTMYPDDPLARGSRQEAASWTAVASAETGPLAPSLAATTPAAIEVRPAPAAAEGFGADLAGLLDDPELTLPAVLLAFGVAVGLGALHALSPGHGKTVMAAYLVGSRASLRMAMGLGLVVTASHTLGVLILALLALWASTIIPLERLYPVLGLASGLIVVGLGSWLLWGRWRAARGGPGQPSYAEAGVPAQAAVHRHEAHPHHHGGDSLGHDQHAHDHHAHDHHALDSHGHDPDAHDLHDHPVAPRPGHDDEGWHRHGLVRHSHVAAASSRSGWRALAALGLAGGMVPSASALILLLGSISVGRPELGVLLTGAFGLGMALVLAGIGVAFVMGSALLDRVPKAGLSGRLTSLVPAAAAVFVLVAGITMTGQALLSLDASRLL